MLDLSGERVAAALDEAIMNLVRTGAGLVQWVPYAHYGILMEGCFHVGIVEMRVWGQYLQLRPDVISELRSQKRITKTCFAE
jgi:hypothetical protein